MAGIPHKKAAALNRAFNDGRVPDDTAWRRVKPFPKVSVARIRYFTRAENISPPNFVVAS